MLSPLVFAGLMFGLTKLLLLQPGRALAACWAPSSGTVVIYWVIDPKLRAVSARVRGSSRRATSRELEQRMRWQDDEGEG